MKKILLITTLISSFAIVASADENSKNYLRLDLGKGFTKKSSNNVISKVGKPSLFNLGFGSEVYDNVRAEANLTLRNKFSGSNRLNPLGVTTDYKLEIKTTTLMLNAYYDIQGFDSFVPYVGVGFGLTKNKATLNTASSISVGSKSKSKIDLSYQLALGTAYKVSSNLDLDFGYRYNHLGKVSKRAFYPGFKLNSHDLLVGVKFKF